MDLLHKELKLSVLWTQQTVVCVGNNHLRQLIISTL